MAERPIHVWAPRLQAFGGGIGASARQLVRSLRAAGHRVATCARDDAGAGPDALGAGGVAVRWRPLVFAYQALRLAMRERPALIVTLHVNFAPVAYCAARLLGVPYAVVAHGVEIGEALSPLRRCGLRHATRVWAVSRWTRDRAIALGVDALRVDVIGNTYDEARFTPGPAREQTSGALPVALTVARLDPGEGYKGCDVVLHAVALLRARGVHLRYRLVGSGDDAARLRALAGALDVSQVVEFAGQLDDAALLQAYREADVYVMPSRGEGFGIVFLEAMASGTPVIGGALDGTTDALRDGALGRLVDPADPAAVADALQAMVEQRGPATWFDPAALHHACRDAHGHVAFDRVVARAVARVGEGVR